MPTLANEKAMTDSGDSFLLVAAHERPPLSEAALRHKMAARAGMAHSSHWVSFRNREFVRSRLSHFHQAGPRSEDGLDLRPGGFEPGDEHAPQKIAGANPKHLRAVRDPARHSSKILILGDDDRAFGERARPDVGVIGVAQSDLSQCGRVMTPIAQPLCELGRKLCVHNEPHCLFGGNDDWMAELGNGVGEARTDVFWLQVRKVH